MRDDETMNDERLARPLRDMVSALREERDVPELWRARVLHEVGRASVLRRRRQRMVVAAAAVLFVIAGSAVLRTHGSAGSELAPAGPSVARIARTEDAAPVRFTLRAPGAHRVALVGDFDAWTPEGRPMRRSADGRTWQLDVQLPPGRHAFAYLVDGVLRADPVAARAVEDDFGVPSSVVVVASRGI